jgi:hypothetical protein
VVRVTTVAGNYCKSLTNWNPGIRKHNASLPPRSMGLLGPVRFLRARDEPLGPNRRVKQE